MYQRLLYGLGAPVTKSFPLGLTKYSDFFCIYTRQYFKNVSTADSLHHLMVQNGIIPKYI